MLDNFYDIYQREIRICEDGGSSLEKLILNSKDVKMFVYEVCKNCVKDELKRATKQAVEAEADCDYCGINVYNYCPRCGKKRSA